jgi:hypothetical protein
MDITHLLANTAAKAPLAGKPTGNAEPGAPFASVGGDAADGRGRP